MQLSVRHKLRATLNSSLLADARRALTVRTLPAQKQNSERWKHPATRIAECKKATLAKHWQSDHHRSPPSRPAVLLLVTHTRIFFHCTIFWRSLCNIHLAKRECENCGSAAACRWRVAVLSLIFAIWLKGASGLTPDTLTLTADGDWCIFLY